MRVRPWLILAAMVLGSHRLWLPVPDRRNPWSPTGATVRSRLRDLGHADRRLHAARWLPGHSAGAAQPSLGRPSGARRRPCLDDPRPPAERDHRGTNRNWHRPQRRRRRWSCDDRAAKQDHSRLVHRPLVHVGNQRLGGGLSYRRRPRPARPPTIGSRLWLAGVLPVRCDTHRSRSGDVPRLIQFVATHSPGAHVQIAERTRVPLADGRRPHLDRLYCRLFGIHRVRSIGDGGPWREPGLDRTRPDHRHLGERSRHHAGRQA